MRVCIMCILSVVVICSGSLNMASRLLVSYTKKTNQKRFPTCSQSCTNETGNDWQDGLCLAAFLKVFQ